jgi:hypothetical protein
MSRLDCQFTNVGNGLRWKPCNISRFKDRNTFSIELDPNEAKALAEPKLKMI